MNILIVDDEIHIRRLLSSILKKSNYNVIEAESGEQAFEILQKNSINLIISDWVMNGMTGLELCKQVRSDFKKQYIYFILLTSKNNKDELIQGMEAGADDFITKPFNIEELKVRIRAGERIVKQEIEIIERNKKINDSYQKMQKDLEAASKLQKIFLPNKDVIVNILHESILPDNNLKINNIMFDWMFIPSQFLAGDVFNIFRLDENNIGLYLIDVAGHGVSASLLSVTLSRMLIPFQNNVLKYPINTYPFYEITEPAKVAYNLNNHFNDDDSMQYFTMVYIIINTISGKATICKAGHTSTIIQKDNNEIITLDNPSFPIGLLPSVEYEEESLFLEKGDRLIIYSDGIIECKDKNNNIFDENTFIQYIKESKNTNLNDMIKNLKKRLIEWSGKEEFEDDISLLAIEIT